MYWCGRRTSKWGGSPLGRTAIFQIGPPILGVRLRFRNDAQGRQQGHSIISAQSTLAFTLRLSRGSPFVVRQAHHERTGTVAIDNRMTLGKAVRCLCWFTFGVITVAPSVLDSPVPGRVHLEGPAGKDDTARQSGACAGRQGYIVHPRRPVAPERIQSIPECYNRPVWPTPYPHPAAGFVSAIILAASGTGALDYGHAP